MFRRLMKPRAILLAAGGAVIAAVAILTATINSSADDLTGLALLRVARVAHGGSEYAGLQNVTAQSQGFVNVAPFGAVGLGTGPAAGAVEIKFKLTDYQDKEMRRRLDVRPTGPVIGETFLVYTGSEGGGKYMGNEFRVSETTASRQWAMMGFGTLNRAADGQFPTTRQKDQTDGSERYYVVDVKFSPQDTVRFFINQNDFLVNKVTTLYNNKPLVEETRSDFRKVSCMMLPFRIVTRLQGQRLADLAIDSYDIKTVVPAARFTLTVSR